MSNIPPITYRAIEQAVSRFLKNPSAQVRLLPGEYRFNVDINVDDLQHMNEPDRSDRKHETRSFGVYAQRRIE